MISSSSFLLYYFVCYKYYFIYLRFYLELIAQTPLFIHSVNSYGDPAILLGMVISHGLHLQHKATKAQDFCIYTLML